MLRPASASILLQSRTRCPYDAYPLSVWIPNEVFTALGLGPYLTMGWEAVTSRGGGWDDLVWSVRKAVTRPFGRRTPRGAGR